MIRTQIQLPESLHRRARALADRREISLAELVRRGLEYMLATAGRGDDPGEEWVLPEPRDLGGNDPFGAADWRMRLHVDACRAVADAGGAYAPVGEDDC